MNNFDLKQIIQMAQDGDEAALTALPQECLAKAIISLNDQLIQGNAASFLSEHLEAANKVISTNNDLTDVSIYIDRISDMERQLTETEVISDRLQEQNHELEDALQSALERVAELKQKLSTVKKAGRPDKYDDKFRAEVRDYYEEGHTYRETADYFNVSTNTVGRFLKDE